MRQTYGLTCMLSLVAIFAGVMPGATFGQIEYTPDSPEVQAIVWKAVDYMRNSKATEIGPVALRALAISEANLRYNQMIPTDDPLIQAGVSLAQSYTKEANGKAVDGETMYATGVCAVLLSLFGDTYHENLQSVLELIEARQQVGGSWGYRTDGTGRDFGDTSQTQYCCLAMWVANRAGLSVKPEMARKAMEWLIDTQTEGGGWQYRASRGQGSGGARGETLSLVAAGCGSVYMLADVLGALPGNKGVRRTRRADPNLPRIVQEFVPEDEAKVEGEVRPALFSPDSVRATTIRGNNWLRQNFRPDPDQWRYYFLYGFERYAYFREATEGEVTDIPNWYDQGVKFLIESQNDDGSFRSPDGSEGTVPPAVTTSFAILFLVRSTELLASESLTGVVQGGQGFATGSLSLRSGQIVGEQIVQNVEDFLRAIEQGKELDLAKFSGSLNALEVPTDPAQRALYMQQLRVLVNDVDFSKRYVAVRFLGSVRELDNVPALIYAMTDPTPEIVIAAHNGLRFISRKIDSIQLPDVPNRENCKGIKEQWEKWYLSIRPDADLMYESER